MNSVQILLDRFWVTRRQDKELYYQIRRDLDTVRKFVQDYPGWRLLQNEQVIRIEKIPAHGEPFMGIQSFTNKLDYCLLCALLIFLEDREENESFLLSELTDRIEIQLKPVCPIDWTIFSNRKSLIRVMQWCEMNGLLILHEGNLDALSNSMKEEVLYENTGLSRYLALSYPFDCSSFQTADDYEQMELQDTDMDRGHFRINRVYRKLLLSPAMYWQNNEDADALYLKNQRTSVSKYLHDYTGYRMDIHKNAAFLVKEEEADRFGKLFPDTSTLSDIILLMCSLLRENVSDFQEDETVSMPRELFQSLVHDCIKRYSGAWSKEYREINETVLEERILSAMEEWSMLEDHNDIILLQPGAFLFAGNYTESFDSEVIKQKRSKRKSAPVDKLSLF